MSSVETLMSMHREDMALLRTEAKQARKERLDNNREMDLAFKDLRSKLSAEMPVTSSFSIKLRAPFAVMTALMGVLSF
ncbi:hypothetical protein [Desulfovibrio sp. JC022]|uniref:hypothetical protein n=1 Tax=Desulfovibrio sp. JC022 TaxID=2593642 RepID=UPI0013D201F2|nr:hypothetical protein [Desulfovibrio sp. JC022]NDV22391.1 hypothetical protein [Desulfovibrio sp. JC022]